MDCGLSAASPPKKKIINGISPLEPEGGSAAEKPQFPSTAPAARTPLPVGLGLGLCSWVTFLWFWGLVLVGTELPLSAGEQGRLCPATGLSEGRRRGVSSHDGDISFITFFFFILTVVGCDSALLKPKFAPVKKRFFVLCTNNFSTLGFFFL